MNSFSRGEAKCKQLHGDYKTKTHELIPEAVAVKCVERGIAEYRHQKKLEQEEKKQEAAQEDGKKSPQHK